MFFLSPNYLSEVRRGQTRLKGLFSPFLEAERIGNTNQPFVWDSDSPHPWTTASKYLSIITINVVIDVAGINLMKLSMLLQELFLLNILPMKSREWDTCRNF